MNNLSVFSNSVFQDIRCIGELDNKIWFVAKDVAENLGYSDTAKAVRTHCKGVNSTLVPSNGGTQTQVKLSESIAKGALK